MVVDGWLLLLMLPGWSEEGSGRFHGNWVSNVAADALADLLEDFHRKWVSNVAADALATQGGVFNTPPWVARATAAMLPGGIKVNVW